jgi:hypothetical protein
MAVMIEMLTPKISNSSYYLHEYMNQCLEESFKFSWNPFLQKKIG